MALRKKPKTLYDFNHERKRDLNINAKPKYEKPNPIDTSAEVHGKTGYADLDEYPNSFIRDYQLNAFSASMKLIHPRLQIFKNILRIDMSGQLIGDEKLEELCQMLPKCPLEILSLNECDVTDSGMEILSSVLRSLPLLRQLNLSSNLFTDTGVSYLFQSDKYSPNLESLHLSRNGLTLKSAYYIGQMFAPEMKCKLDSLYLGGRLGEKSFGNEFIRVLVGALCKPCARPIKLLHYPDAGLTDDGIASICALITCSSDIRELNISKNPIVSNTSKSHLKEALRLNISIELLYIRQCGLSKHEMGILQDAVKSRSPLTWHEKTLLGLLTAKELEECTRVSYNIEVTLVSVYLKKPPPAWPPKRVSSGEFSECLDFESLANYYNILPKAFNDTMNNCSFMTPYIDALVEFIEKGKDWLNMSQTKKIEKDTIVEQNQLLEESFLRYTKRRGSVISTRTSLKQIVDVFIVSVNTSSPKGKIEIRKSIVPVPVSPSRSKRTKKVSSDQMCMAAEDYNASLIELSISYEEHIGLLHKTKLLRDDEDLDLLIPYYELELAACYTHFIYLTLPAEEARKIYEAMMEARKAEAKRQEDLRKQKKLEKEQIKSLKKSLKKGTQGGRKIRPKTEDDIKILEQRAMLLAELQESNLFLQIEQKMKNQRKLDAIARKKKEEEDKKEAAEEAFDEEKDWDDEVPTYREPTQLLVWKKEIINRFKGLLITRADQERANAMNSRAYRNKVIRRVPAINLTSQLQDKNITIYFEDEDERSESFGSLAHVNTTRCLVNLQNRIYHRKQLQKDHWASLCH